MFCSCEYRCWVVGEAHFSLTSCRGFINENKPPLTGMFTQQDGIAARGMGSTFQIIPLYRNVCSVLE